MQVEALANSLHMRFLAPNIENEPETWTMRNIYNSWAYNVQYWKNGSDEKVSSVNHTHFRHRPSVSLSVGLRPWRWREEVRVPPCQVVAPYSPEDLRPGALSARSFPFWGVASIWLVLSRPQGKHVKLTSRVLGSGSRPFSPWREVGRRQSWPRGWLGELWVTWVRWSAPWLLFMAWTPLSHGYHRTVKATVRAAHPWVPHAQYHSICPIFSCLLFSSGGSSFKNVNWTWRDLVGRLLLPLCESGHVLDLSLLISAKWA